MSSWEGLDLEAMTAAIGSGQGLASSVLKQTTAPVGREWQPGIKFDPNGAMVATTPAVDKLPNDQNAWKALLDKLDFDVPEGWQVRLVEAKYDPAAWTRAEPGDDAVTQAVWRYKFAVEPASLSGFGAEDIAQMIRDAMSAKRGKKKEEGPVDRSLVVVYADPQVGKTDDRGGTPELLARVAEKFDKLDDHIRDLKKIGRGVNAAAWLDGGDCIENFENTAQQAQTNDLTLTQMVRLHRRLTFDGLSILAKRFNKVTAAVCASNHGQVRRGGKQVGPPSDDWGIEVMSQVADAFALNPDVYGHVSFVVPEQWRENVSVDVSGYPIGLVHGHQYPNPDKALDWWQKQAFSDQAVAGAKLLVTNHYHHFRARSVGNGKLILQAPTLDNGSAWWTNKSGEQAPAGLLVFSVTKDGVDDLRIL